jgi:hypothetical protein
MMPEIDFDKAAPAKFDLSVRLGGVVYMLRGPTAVELCKMGRLGTGTEISDVLIELDRLIGALFVGAKPPADLITTDVLAGITRAVCEHAVTVAKAASTPPPLPPVVKGDDGRTFAN